MTDLVRIEFEDGRLLPYLGRRSLTNGGGSVVVRVWRGKSSAANAGAYKRFLQEAAERSAPGPSDMHQQVWVRQGAARAADRIRLAHAFGRSQCSPCD